MREVVLGSGLGLCGFLCCLLACSCAVETGVIQAVSGSCDQKHSAQQLETTYVTQLQYETSESLHTLHSSFLFAINFHETAKNCKPFHLKSEENLKMK